MKTIKDQIIQKQDEFIAYLTKAIKSESILEAITIGIRDQYTKELASLKSRMSEESKEPDGAEEVLEKTLRGLYPQSIESKKAIIGAMHDFARQRLRSELISFLNSIDTDSFLNMSSEERLVDEYLSGYAT